MLLRSALGMGIVMVLMGLAQNIWQFLILRALLGLLGGFVPNANALIATQVPRNKSGWALGTLCGAVASGFLPPSVRNALSIAIYGMFIAIVVPPAKKNRDIFVAVVLALIGLSTLKLR